MTEAHWRKGLCTLWRGWRLAGDREVKLGVGHTLLGNPNRFDTGAVELRQDSDWQSKINPCDRGLVTALTGPLPKHGRYHVD